MLFLASSGELILSNFLGLQQVQEPITNYDCVAAVFVKLVFAASQEFMNNEIGTHSLNSYRTVQVNTNKLYEILVYILKSSNPKCVCIKKISCIKTRSDIYLKSRIIRCTHLQIASSPGSPSMRCVIIQRPLHPRTS